MTKSNNYVPVKTLGNGSTTDFSFPWAIISNTYLKVYLEDVTTSAQTLQVQGSDYTLAWTQADDNSGGIVTFLSAPTSGYYVILTRDVDLTQTVPYRTSVGFDGKGIENSFDKDMVVIQTLNEIVGRTIQLPIGVVPSETILLPEADAGKALIWNSTGTNLTNSTDDFNDIVTDATAQAVIATTQAGLASASATAAGTAQTNAETAETNAETAEALAEDWASKVDGIVDATEYSSKAHAIGGTGVDGVSGSSKAWAITAEDTEVITGEYSAYHWAKKSEASANNPMTTAGDIIVGGTSGTPERLGIGTEGQVLTVESGDVVWKASSGGGSFGNATSGTHSGSVLKFENITTGIKIRLRNILASLEEQLYIRTSSGLDVYDSGASDYYFKLSTVIANNATAPAWYNVNESDKINTTVPTSNEAGMNSNLDVEVISPESSEWTTFVFSGDETLSPANTGRQYLGFGGRRSTDPVVAIEIYSAFGVSFACDWYREELV